MGRITKPFRIISFKKIKPIDVVFVIKDDFEGNKAEDNQKYALVKEISVGISGENYYEVKSGLFEGQTGLGNPREHTALISFFSKRFLV